MCDCKVCRKYCGSYCAKGYELIKDEKRDFICEYDKKFQFKIILIMLILSLN